MNFFLFIFFYKFKSRKNAPMDVHSVQGVECFLFSHDHCAVHAGMDATVIFYNAGFLKSLLRPHRAAGLAILARVVSEGNNRVARVQNLVRRN